MSTKPTQNDEPARFDRVGARHLTSDRIIRDFATFTARAAEHKTPCITEPDLFFTPGYEKQAKARCATCPLIDPCLGFALDARQNDGVWGGLDEIERKKILRARQAAKQRRWKQQREARARANQTPLFDMAAMA